MTVGAHGYTVRCGRAHNGGMPRIGITGHVRLTEGSAELIYPALVAALGEATREYGDDDLCGVTCLAAGADQLFAHAVLERNGRLEVVLPAEDYRSSQVRPDERRYFDSLLRRASRISVLPFARSGITAYRAAGRTLLDRCDLLIAVWDRGASGRRSCTEELVDEARRRRRRVRVVWPDGAARTD
jgi:hypothetical protein